MFSGNDELADRAIAQVSNSLQHQPQNQQLTQSQQQQQGQYQPQQQQQYHHHSPVLANPGLSYKSPRTPKGQSGALSPSDTVTHSSSAIPPYYIAGTSPVLSTPVRRPSVPADQPGQTSIHLPHPQEQHQQQQLHQQNQHQRHHSFSFDKGRESPDRVVPGHRHAVSAVPYGSISPPAFPMKSPQSGPYVRGFYPPQLVPPRMPPLQQPPPSAIPPPPPQQLHPQQQQVRPQQPQSVPQPMTLPVPQLPVPVNAASPGTVPGPHHLTVPLIQPQSPTHTAPQSHFGSPGGPQLQSPQAATSSGTNMEGLGSSMPIPQLTPDRERVGVKRPLAPQAQTPTGSKQGGRGRTHRHSLSTGSDLQIHQWKPKQLLRDNRWRITNPFARSKEKKSGDQPVSDLSSSDQQAQTSTGPSVQSESNPVQTGDSEKVGDQARQQHQHQQQPVQSPVQSPSSAAVVAAHNNKRRSMTHARRKSAMSVSIPTKDDENRHDEGVAVLASLASEQWRRDSDAVQRQPSSLEEQQDSTKRTLRSPIRGDDTSPTPSEGQRNIPGPVHPPT